MFNQQRVNRRGNDVLNSINMNIAAVFSICVTLVLGLGLATETASAQSAPRPGVPLNLDGQASLKTPPPLVEEVEVINRLNEQVPLDVTFTDSNGMKVKLGDIFKGDRPVVLQCGYFNCPSLCGMVLNGLLDAMKSTSLKVGEDYDVISLSISHEEGPELSNLKKMNYVAALGQPEASAGWHFLTGDEAAIRRVTNAVGYGFRYMPRQDEYAHPAVIMILTPKGKVYRYLSGIQYEPSTYHRSLIEASEGQIGTVWDMLLMTCFTYDETAGQYNWYAMGLMRLAGGFTVLVIVVVIGSLLLKGSLAQRTANKAPSQTSTGTA